MSVDWAGAGAGRGSGSGFMAAADPPSSSSGPDSDPQRQPLLPPPPPPPQRQRSDLRTADFASDNPALSVSSSTISSASSAASSRTKLSDDGGVVVGLLSASRAPSLMEEGVAVGDAEDSFSVCTMQTVSVSSLLMPSPCFIVALLLLPPVIGFLLYLFVEFFVPVLVDILVDM
ncbi:putative helicase senataxin [Frankliniella fusca]|uniref:Helicase senataxin n=1 Tax=Frankliniella fusca TaxID=407009 RepID=A0AAE1GZL1_9NEOP|nr:putative helicase senataxin [Frankliniella fusca]